MGKMSPIIITPKKYKEIKDILLEEHGLKAHISFFLKNTHGFTFRFSDVDPRSISVDFWNDSAKVLFLLKFDLGENR